MVAAPLFFAMVPGSGIEPVQAYARGILSPKCSPLVGKRPQHAAID